MGIKSTIDWSGVIVNGVVLGEPAVDEVTGEMHWDGGVPNGLVTIDGDFKPDGKKDDGTDYELVNFVTMGGVDFKLKEPKDTKVVYEKQDVPRVDENGDPVLDDKGEQIIDKVEVPVEVPNTYVKGQTVFFEGKLYVCNKDDILFDAASKDWVEPKTKEIK